MGNCLYDGQPFRLDPESVSVSFSVRSNSIETIGGRVVQIYGVQWNDLIIVGSFGKGAARAFGANPFQDQREFLDRMKAIGDRQSELITQSEPQKFIWPEQGWNFRVYLKEYTDTRGNKPIQRSPDEVNPKWQLTFFVVEDNANLTQGIADDFLARLAKGLGWKQTEYNGPLDDVLAPGFYALPGRNPKKSGPVNITQPEPAGPSGGGTGIGTQPEPAAPNLPGLGRGGT
jgi:hypothetical protein